MYVMLFCMARLARIIATGIPHHVVQRGNRRLDVFFNDEDREVYITYLKNAAETYGVNIWAWCLMSNHVHFIVVPMKEDSLSKCFSDAHVRYTRRINFREGWRGHLWQGRFGSSPLDEKHMLVAVRYVERNPVRAKMVRMPWRYKWSSAAYHVGIKDSDPLLSGDEILSEYIKDWQAYLLEKGDAEEIGGTRRP